MIIVDFGLTGFSVKKGKLFGKHSSFPLKIFRLGVLTLTYLDEPARHFFKDTLKGCMKDSDYLILNNRYNAKVIEERVKEHKEKLENIYKDEIKWLNKYYKKSQKDLMKAQQENRALKEVLKILKEDE